jgi:hypothetical protein
MLTFRLKGNYSGDEIEVNYKHLVDYIDDSEAEAEQLYQARNLKVGDSCQLSEFTITRLT